MAPPPARSFQQTQPITTTLKNICESYPAETCLRELLQNADDAGATEIEYVLDTGKYTDGPLLHKGLQGYQGPALLVRNNSVFTDSDFGSLSSVGDSIKRHDALSTGKFGRGFNSVYHWTDGPCIFSRNWLLFLDPHEYWSNDPIIGMPGGPTWDIAANKESLEIQNHLKAFAAFKTDVSRGISQTIIRVPLRTSNQAARSKISKREIKADMIKEALEDFGQEMKEGGLLFLKHVKKIILRIDEQILSTTQILEDDVGSMLARQEVHKGFKDLYGPLSRNKGCFERSFKLDIEHSTSSSCEVCSYLIEHAMKKGSGNKAMDEWACEEKLFPWIAVAAPLNVEPFNGRLFSTLRLPILTNQPVHIHGLWSITPDRGRLSSSGRSSNIDDFAVKWNDFLFKNCVPAAWTSILARRNTISWREERFNLWPQVVESPTSIWQTLDEPVLDVIIKQNLSVWTTASRCVSIAEGFFSDASLASDEYASALAQVQMPIVYLDQSLLRKLNSRISSLAPIKIPKIRSSSSARSFIQSQNLSGIPPKDLSLLLEYSLIDARISLDAGSPGPSRTHLYKDLKEIAFWPNLTGSMSKLGQETLLPRDAKEQNLFRGARGETTLDISRLTDPVLSLLRKDISVISTATSIRYRKLIDLLADWSTIYPVVHQLASSGRCIARSPGLDLTLHNIWDWVHLKAKEEERIPPSLDLLWLVPVRNGIGQYAPGSKSPPVLMFQEGEKLSKLIVNMVSTRPEKAPPVLDLESISPKALRFLTKKARAEPKLRGAFLDDLVTFVSWLFSGQELLSTASDEQRVSILQHLEDLTRAQIREIDQDLALKAVLREQLRSLPLFSKIILTPDQSRALVACSLDNQRRALEAPKGFPATVNISDVTFYDFSNSSEKYMTESFKLVEAMPLEELLIAHLLPWIDSARDSSSAASKYALVEFIFSNSRRPSSTWIAQVNSKSIVPLPFLGDGTAKRYESLLRLVDPSGSILPSLYFKDESVFPCKEFFHRHKEALQLCGIRRRPNWDTPLERVRVYATCGKAINSIEEKVECLLKLPVHKDLIASQSSVLEIQRLKWLPGCLVGEPKTALISPDECRGADETHLVNFVLPTAKFSVGDDWKKILGWDCRIEKRVLLRQLDCCLSKEEHVNIDQVLVYLQNHFQQAEYSELSTTPCILGSRGKYLLPGQAFHPGSDLTTHSLAPYLDEVDIRFARQHSALLKALNICEEPSLNDLLGIHRVIGAKQGPLNDSDLHIVIASLELASRGFNTDQLADLMVPDTQNILRRLPDIVHGDILVGDVDGFNFTNSAISSDLIKRLGLENAGARATRLEIDFQDEDEDEYTPREKLSTVISDTLGRYSIASTFNEFLANAEDCHATRMGWIVDECQSGPHESSSLLSPDLKPFQGSALFAYNDRVFSEKDFAGFKEIGHGGKGDDTTTTGMFGRGALTMYHFTDVPMIISGGSILILDPQQELLPRNKHWKRKVGVKISLETISHRWPHQLVPFDGLYGYFKNLNYYDGTLFRFPFRRSNTTILKESSELVDSAVTIKLLEEYYESAHMALLFLRNVTSIECSVRGSKGPLWSVRADRSKGSEEDIFRHITLRHARKTQEPREETWLIGMTDLDQRPADVENPGRAAGKVTEIGVAACIWHNHIPHKVRHKVFCKLPTAFDSELPISFHASFAITGDRQSIPFQDVKGDPILAKWNLWLLTDCIPGFYLEFLKVLGPKLGASSFDFWPTRSNTEFRSNLSTIVSDAFWKKLLEEKHGSDQIYPIIEIETSKKALTSLARRPGGKTRKLHTVTSIGSAQFDLLSESSSRILRPLFHQVCPCLVRPPWRLWDSIRPALLARHSVCLNTTYLSQLFKEETNCKILDGFLLAMTSDKSRIEALEALLSAIVPQTGVGPCFLNILNGCRIIPKIDGSLGLLTLATESKTEWMFTATEEERQIFDFVPHLLVNDKIFRPPTAVSHTPETKNRRNPIEEIVNSGQFNVRPLQVSDAGKLLADSRSPTRMVKVTARRDALLSRLWDYLNANLRIIHSSNTPSKSAVDFLSSCSLMEHSICRICSGLQWSYLTPSQIEHQPCIVEPKKKTHLKLCQDITGLGLLDPQCLPSIWREAEDDLAKGPSFVCFLKALARIKVIENRPLEISLSEKLSSDSVKALTELFLCQKDFPFPDDAELKAVARALPVWPRHKPLVSSKLQNCVSASVARFCLSPRMLLPWVKNLEDFVAPDTVKKHKEFLEKLGIHIMPAQEVWQYVARDQPKNLDGNNSDAYSGLILELSLHRIRPSIDIAPNGAGTFCKAESLFDHADEIFKAAFRQETTTQFLLPTLRSHRIYWLSLGLRARDSDQVMNSQDYLECALAIKRRWTLNTCTQAFRQDAEKVAGYLCWDKPAFRRWPNLTWTQIAKIPMFRVDQDVSQQSLYRHPRMLELASMQDHQSLDQSGNIKDVRILWSQTPFLHIRPTTFVFETLPNSGRPASKMVLQHIRYLVQIRKQIGGSEIPEYLKDIQASYSFLQENVEATRSIPNISDADIWFNLDTTEVDIISVPDLDQALMPAKLLCLNSPVDPLPIKVARKFLVPYERLLKGLGCQSVVQPKIEPNPSSSHSSETPIISALAQMRKLRDQRQLIDVVFEAEGIEKDAHKICMAAVSEYCEKQFSGEWGRVLERQAKIHVGEMRFLTLSQMVDYVYTGNVEWPQLQEQDNNDEIAEKLDVMLDLLRGADRWMIPRLHSLAEDFLMCNSKDYVRPDNVKEVKKAAEEARASRLVNHCASFIILNPKLVADFDKV